MFLLLFQVQNIFLFGCFRCILSSQYFRNSRNQKTLSNLFFFLLRFPEKMLCKISFSRKVIARCCVFSLNRIKKYVIALMNKTFSVVNNNCFLFMPVYFLSYKSMYNNLANKLTEVVKIDGYIIFSLIYLLLCIFSSRINLTD